MSSSDLKPDNIGFAADGTLKIFDFGLMTAIVKRTNEKEAYKMTGRTGSLRYMAPEVYLRQPYNEKVDVYSFGVILWQLASNQLPFEGFGRREMEEKVMKGGYRPAMDRRLPATLRSLISRCWATDHTVRPPFSEIVKELEIISNEVSSLSQRKSPR